MGSYEYKIVDATEDFDKLTMNLEKVFGHVKKIATCVLKDVMAQQAVVP